MRKGLRNILKLGEVGILIKLSCSLLQADTPLNKREQTYLKEKAEHAEYIYEYNPSDTTILKKAYNFYDLCGEN